MHSVFVIVSLLSAVITVHSRAYPSNLIKSLFQFLIEFNFIILECSIDIQNDLNRTATGIVKEPLFVKYSDNEYILMIPEDGTLDFKTGASALIACTSDTKPNYLDYSKTYNILF